MGSVKKIGDGYVIEFLARGLKYQQKAGPDRKKAEELLRGIEEKLAKGELALAVRDVDFDVFFHDFLESSKGELPLKTFSRFKRAVGHFEKFLRLKHHGITRLSQITPSVLEGYRASLLTVSGKKSAREKSETVNSALFLLRHVFDCAIKDGCLNDNPLLHIRFIQGPPGQRPSVIDRGAYAALLKASPPHLSRIVEFIVLTGLDVREVCRLCWRDVDWKNRVVRIRPRFKMCAREIPLQPGAQEILKEVKSARSVRSVRIFADSSGVLCRPGALIRELREAVGRADIKIPVSFTSFRHMFASELISRKVPLMSLRKILGHEDIAETLIYAPFIFEEDKDGLYRVSS